MGKLFKFICVSYSQHSHINKVIINNNFWFRRKKCIKNKIIGEAIPIFPRIMPLNHILSI